MTPTVKRGSGSVIVWGSMAATGVRNLHFIERIMDHMKYIEILRTIQCCSFICLGRRWILQQDNYPKHTA